MSVPKARIVRGLVVAAFVVTCLALGLTSAVAQRGGGRGGFVFHGSFGRFHGCFNCGAFRFRGGFGFGFAPAWGWGWPAWGWGWPGWGWGWPGWGWPGWVSPGWASPGWVSPGWASPGWASQGPPAYAGGPPLRPSRQSCFAGAYVCPIDRAIPSGSACSCLSNNRTRVPGRAS